MRELHLVPTETIAPLLEELTGVRAVDPSLMTVYPDFVEKMNMLVPPSLIARLLVFRERGWTAGTVGIEWHTVAPAGPLVTAVAEGLAARGAAIVDGDWVVDRVRLVKSPAELECVRRASEIVDGAFERIRTKWFGFEIR